MIHPNVIRIREFGDDRTYVFVVMEIFRGPNLKQALRESAELIRYLAPQIIRRAAEGLDYFHKQTWIHRDIKPDNFLVSDDGDVRLIDFSIAQRQKRGIARLLAGKPKVQGTLSYMSPEQIRGENLDFRSDIYSFGCMLYEMVGGKLPYTGTSGDELLNKHLRAPIPPLLAANNAVTTQFADLVASMMAKARDARPASMEEMIEQFQKLRVYRVRPKPPAPNESADP